MNRNFDLFRKKEKEKLLENKEEVKNIISEKNNTKIKIFTLFCYLGYSFMIIFAPLPGMKFSKIDTITMIFFLFLSWYGWNRGNKYALIGIIILTINFSKYIILEHYFLTIIIIVVTIVTVFYHTDKVLYKGVFNIESVGKVKNKKYYFLYFLLIPFTSYGVRTRFFEAYPFAEYLFMAFMIGFFTAMFDFGSMRELKRKIRKINKRESNDRI